MEKVPRVMTVALEKRRTPRSNAIESSPSLPSPRKKRSFSRSWNGIKTMFFSIMSIRVSIVPYTKVPPTLKKRKKPGADA